MASLIYNGIGALCMTLERQLLSPSAPVGSLGLQENKYLFMYMSRLQVSNDIGVLQ